MTNHWTQNADVEYDPREDDLYDAARHDGCCDYVHSVTIEGRGDDLRCTRQATVTKTYVDPYWGADEWSLCAFHAELIEAEERRDAIRKMTPQDIEIARQVLIVSAEMRHAEFPQYAGHWDGWQVARVTRTLQWRNYPGEDNVMARENDLVLVEPPFTMLPGLNVTGHRKAHLPDSPVGSGRGVDTMVPASALEVLG